MDKELDSVLENGYSESQMDKSANKMQDLDQVKAGNIFDGKQKNKKRKKVKEKVILDLQNQ